MEDFPGVGKLGLCFPDLAVSLGGFRLLGSWEFSYQVPAGFFAALGNGGLGGEDDEDTGSHFCPFVNRSCSCYRVVVLI